MSRTIEAVMRHMVPPAKREPARKASRVLPFSDIDMPTGNKDAS